MFPGASAPASVGETIMGVYTGIAYDNVRINSGVAENLTLKDCVAENLTFSGGESAPAKLTLPTYTVATAPDASTMTGAVIYVSNGAEGSPIVAFSEGTNWLRVDTAAAIAAS